MKSPFLTVASEIFTVKHYAGAVNYHEEQFCEKNRDLLSTDLIEMMQGSTMLVIETKGSTERESEREDLFRSFIARLFPEQTSNIKSRPTTAGMKIRSQTHLLIEKLITCQPHCKFIFSNKD